jgi:hypothetical protein
MAFARTILVAACVAAPMAAAAQPATQFELDNLRAQQEAAQRRAVDLQNQLSAAEARLRADQAVSSLQLQQRLPQTLPVTPYPQAPRASTAAAGAKYPQIPAAALAQSNQRVQAAARNRR